LLATEPLATTLATSGQQSSKSNGQQPPAKKTKQLKALATSGKQRKENLEEPPKPKVPDGIQAAFEWRGKQNKSGDSWTLWFRLYKVENRKKKWLKSSYVFYISVQQWERLKTYDRDKQRNYIQADFDHWWEATEAERTAGAANGAG